MNQIIETNAHVKDVPMILLDENEISVVGGGNPFFIAIAGCAGTFGALNAAEQFGEKIGKAMYYALH
jgi:hypothetical protein